MTKVTTYQFYCGHINTPIINKAEYCIKNNVGYLFKGRNNKNTFTFVYKREKQPIAVPEDLIMSFVVDYSDGLVFKDISIPAAPSLEFYEGEFI